MTSNREESKQGEDRDKTALLSEVDEKRDVTARKSQVNPLPKIEQYRSPARGSTMRNVLLAVNRIQEATKLPRDLSSGGVTTMLYKDENDRPDGGSQGSEETKRPAVKKNNRFSHTGVGVTKAIEKVEKAKDSDFDAVTEVNSNDIPGATHQRRSHLNEDDPVEGEQELLEKDTEMAPERE